MKEVKVRSGKGKGKTLWVVDGESGGIRFELRTKKETCVLNFTEALYYARESQSEVQFLDVIQAYNRRLWGRKISCFA